MKMKLTVDVKLGGKIEIVKRNKEVVKAYNCPTSDEYDNTKEKELNFNNVSALITIDEEVEDISAKEFIQCVGSTIKDIFAGTYEKPNKEEKQEKSDTANTIPDIDAWNRIMVAFGLRPITCDGNVVWIKD